MLSAKHNGLEFEIKEDNPDVGAYLYVYERGRCVRDSLQDNIDRCVNIAFRDYGVQKDLWEEVPGDPPARG